MASLASPLVTLPLHAYRESPTAKPAFLTVKNDRHFAGHPLLSLLDKCTNTKQLKQIHAQILRGGLFFDSYSASRLFAALSLPPSSDLMYARKVFDEIPRPNIYTWNTLIRAYASSDDPAESLLIFLRLLHECPELPNKFTYPFVIKAATVASDIRVGRAVHGMVVKSILGSDLFILNALVHLYGACGQLDLAYRLFVRIMRKDVVSWNSMITAFVQGGCPEAAVDLFQQMEMENVKPNQVTMVGLLSACAKKGDLEQGRLMHSYIEKNSINLDLTLNNAILDMYTKCGRVNEAKRLFDEMPEKDIVSWTTMLVGYAKLGDYDEARLFFDAMPCQDVAAWNALISSYEQNGKPKEALGLFHEFLLSKNAKPDEVTLVSALSACSQLGAIDLGRWIHVYIKNQGIKSNYFLTTSLIDMYSKCGDLEKALEVFHSAERKDVCVWSAMIAGLAMYGRGRAAIDLFLNMQVTGIKPNAFTFTNVLAACSHTGLVDEARLLFSQMEFVHGVLPGANHYSCMVDVLGRAGLLEDAVELIKNMPINPTPSVWLSLLGACRLHTNIDLAEMAFSHLLEQDPKNIGAYVLLSNIYAKSGMWEKVSELRKLMRVSELKKEPGCSCIEVNGVVHEFLVADTSHPLSTKIYSKLDEIARRLRSKGYVPNKSQLLQLVQEEDMKEQALYLHSEKLAITFGLLSLEQSQPIRIVKNLRVCGDCHSFAKIVSQLYSREILLRDRYRFHHFKEGVCSCMDYW
ncbi:hypothetical protein Nepgr_013008 [Nepenthes gracilis]|uniref:DYW domain-containing protein n=1 Tax=Nepenthes gracilis TaxID=150966 RepID=A0AAD3SH76_NEPGR|nr:hypothetical protein Nepgr_013008 [Nepenthes gracilis]